MNADTMNDEIERQDKETDRALEEFRAWLASGLPYPALEDIQQGYGDQRPY